MTINVKAKYFIFFSLIISLFGSPLVLNGTTNFSNNLTYAQSPANITLPSQSPANITLPSTTPGDNAVLNGTGSIASNNNNTLNFVSVGDMGCLPETNKTISNMLSRDPELVLALGDLSYQESSQCWLDMMKPLDNKTKITIGDYEWPFSLMMEYINHYNLSYPYYGFNVENVHFLALSNEFNFGQQSQQLKFAEEDLMSASIDPNIDWIVVFYHMPIHFSEHPSTNTEFRNEYHPLFDQFGVDLVLQSHWHSYERTHPIEFNNDERRTPIPTNDTIGNNTYVDPRGPVFATVGTGGIAIDQFEEAQPGFVADRYSGYGVLDIGIQGNQSTTLLNATFHDNDGRVQDNFTILKPSLYGLKNVNTNTNSTVTENPYAKYDRTGAANR